MKYVKIALVLAAAALVNINLVKAPFMYDDRDIIVSNFKLHNIKNLSGVFSRDYYSLTGEMSYRPLTTAVHFINYHFWGKNPIGYRVTEIVLYLLVCFLLYRLTLRLFENETIAFVSVLMFAVHPVHSDALGCISLAYGELLCALFLILAYLYFLKNLASFKITYALASVLFWVLALFSKETAVVFPIIAIFHIIKNEKSKSYHYQFLGYVLIAAAYLAMRFTVFNVYESKYIGYLGGSFFNNALTMSNAFMRYLFTLVFPVNLAAEYPPVIYSSILAPQAALGIIFVLCATAALVWLVAKKKWGYFVSFLWVVVFLLPVMNIVPFLKTSFVYLRYLFIPSIGFAWIIGNLYCQTSERINMRRVANIALVLLTILFATRAFCRNNDWTDEVKLWERNIQLYPTEANYHFFMGSALYYKGWVDDAMEKYNTALLLDPGIADAYINIGIIKKNRGDYQGAMREFEKAYPLVKDLPQDAPNTYPRVNNLYSAIADTFKAAGNEKAALEYYTLAGKRNIYIAEQLQEEARKAAVSKNYDLAISKLLESIKENPDSFSAYANLALLYKQKLMFRESIIYAKYAIELNPEIVQPYFVASEAYIALNKYREAALYLKKALKIEPKEVNLYIYLALCYLNIGEHKKAKSTIEKGLKIAPNDESLKNNYKKILAQIQKTGVK